MNNITYYFLRTFYTKYRSLKKVYNYNQIPKEILENCPACNSKDINIFHNMDRYGFNVNTSWCTKCSLIFVNPRINIEFYNKFYMDGYYRKLIEGISVREQKNLETIPKRLELVLSKIIEIYGKKEISILDIGGTNGIYEYLNQNLNIRKYLCVNPGAEEAEITTSENVEVVNTTIEEYHSSTEKYDLIILFGTISHLMNPYEAFLKSKKLLKDDGLFVLDIKDNLKRMNDVTFPFTLIHFDHPVYFSKFSLESLVNKIGLKIFESMSYKNGLAYYFLQNDNDASEKNTFKADISVVSKMADRCKNISLKTIILNRYFRNK